MNKDIRVSDDVLVSLAEQEGNLLFTIIVQDGYRETRSINLINEEVTKLRDFLNEEVEEMEEWHAKQATHIVRSYTY